MKKTTSKKKAATKSTTTTKKKTSKTALKKTTSSPIKKTQKKKVIKAVVNEKTQNSKTSLSKKTTKKSIKTSKVVQKSLDEATYPQPQVAQAAPDFEATLSSGDTFRLSDVRGRKHIVLYFYPKDDTPGCTKESCAFETKRTAFESHDVMILGVSPDDARSHQKFKTKYGLNFELIADVDHSVSQSYGAWALKSMYGKTYWGVQRSTFLIDKEGIIRNIWPKVSVDGHDEEVEQAIRAL